MEITNNLQTNSYSSCNPSNPVFSVNSPSKRIESTIYENSSFSCCDPIKAFFKSIWITIVKICSVVCNCCYKSKEKEEEDKLLNSFLNENFGENYSKALDEAVKNRKGLTRDQIDIERTKQQNRIEELD